MKKRGIVKEVDVEKAYIIIAKVVHEYGDKYLPVFKRIHNEREAMKANKDLKNIALQIARIALG